METLLATLIAGDHEKALSMFTDDGILDVPTRTRAQGREEVRAQLEFFAGWLANHGATCSQTATIQDEERAAFEYNVSLASPGLELPVLVVSDQTGGCSRHTRIYYTHFTLEGRCLIRAPLIEEKSSRPLPKTVQAYVDGVTQENVEGVLALFEDDGSFRTPSGGPSATTQGLDALRPFYEATLQNGGVPLNVVRYTFDGKICIIEYTLDRWSGVKLPIQAGCAAYELSPRGLIQSVRVYDDIDPSNAAPTD